MLVDHKKYRRKKISNSIIAWEIIREIHFTLPEFERDKERFYVFGLSRTNFIRYIDVVSVGSANATIAEAREVFRMAIHKGVAGGIICFHNHPSGSLKPSSQDNVMTGKLAESGKIIGIELLDHIIFCEEGHYSFADDGNL